MRIGGLCFTDFLKVMSVFVGTLIVFKIFKILSPPTVYKAGHPGRSVVVRLLRILEQWFCCSCPVVVQARCSGCVSVLFLHCDPEEISSRTLKSCLFSKLFRGWIFHWAEGLSWALMGFRWDCRPRMTVSSDVPTELCLFLDPTVGYFQDVSVCAPESPPGLCWGPNTSLVPSKINSHGTTSHLISLFSLQPCMWVFGHLLPQDHVRECAFSCRRLLLIRHPSLDAFSALQLSSHATLEPDTKFWVRDAHAFLGTLNVSAAKCVGQGKY